LNQKLSHFAAKSREPEPELLHPTPPQLLHHHRRHRAFLLLLLVTANRLLRVVEEQG
jgi:hypothetical protein